MTDFNPKAVTIGNQVWMAENLAIDDGGEGIIYNEDNGEYYYTWEAAMRISNSIPGWHLPSALEWNEAALACGATEKPFEGNPNLNDYKDAQGLKDELGVKLTGYYVGSFNFIGAYASFWASTENSSTSAYSRNFSIGTSMGSSYDSKGYGGSVRLVKDN